MSAERRDSTPTSLPGAGPEPLLSGSASNRATTTERRTTTTTTTKRTIKSSDDFVPVASEVQQVRSESRTGSISSTSAPLLNQAPTQQPFSSSLGKGANNWSTISSSTTTTRTSSSSGQQQQQESAAAAAAAAALQSPVILDGDNGARLLKLTFDVSQYEPDEIVVKTVDNRLTVQAKHEERTENRSVYREYNREFHLPDGVDVEQIKSNLSKDGILTVDCPLPQQQLHGSSRRIPIEKV